MRGWLLGRGRDAESLPEAELAAPQVAATVSIDYEAIADEIKRAAAAPFESSDNSQGAAFSHPVDAGLVHVQTHLGKAVVSEPVLPPLLEAATHSRATCTEVTAAVKRLDATLSCLDEYRTMVRAADPVEQVVLNPESPSRLAMSPADAMRARVHEVEHLLTEVERLVATLVASVSATRRSLVAPEPEEAGVGDT